MKRLRARLLIAGAVVVASAAVAVLPALQQPAQSPSTIRRKGRSFRPRSRPRRSSGATPPKARRAGGSRSTFGDGSAAIHAESPGERLRIGEIDPRMRRRHERTAQADAAAGGGADLDAGRRDLGGDQETLRGAPGDGDDHRLRGPGPEPCRFARQRSRFGPRRTRWARRSSTATCR